MAKGGKANLEFLLVKAEVRLALQSTSQKIFKIPPCALAADYGILSPVFTMRG